jgi:hypothetical protein
MMLITRAMQTTRESVFVSQNRLEGSLCDTPLDRVLDSCRQHLVSGVIGVRSALGNGVIELRVGAVDRSQFGHLSGKDALDRMRGLREGIYDLVQRLPDLRGTLGSGASFQGDTTTLSLIALMRHCEEQALSCKIVAVSGFDRGELHYRAGEIVLVSLNGEVDDDKIVDLVNLPNARFLVSAPPLDVDIEGWPTIGRARSEPFVVECRRPREEPTVRLRAIARSVATARVPARTASGQIPPAPASRPSRTWLTRLARHLFGWCLAASRNRDR